MDSRTMTVVYMHDQKRALEQHIARLLREFEVNFQVKVIAVDILKDPSQQDPLVTDVMIGAKL